MTDQTTPLRDRIAAAVHPLLMDTLPEVIAAARAREAADVVLAVLPAPADRAAVVRDFVRELGDRLLGCCQECNACAAIARDLAAEMAESDAELRRVADETAATETDTLPAWLHWRFGPHGQPWAEVPDEDKALWEYQARAVRRAVARGGFKQRAAGARQDGAH